MDIAEQDTELWKPAGAPTGPLNPTAVHRRVKLAEFAQQAVALVDDVDRFIKECVTAVVAGQVDPQDARLIARRPG